MLITNPGGEIAVVHTLTFEDAEQRRQFHEYANTPEMDYLWRVKRLGTCS